MNNMIMENQYIHMDKKEAHNTPVLPSDEWMKSWSKRINLSVEKCHQGLNKKIIIFFSSIGQGHISAALSIKQEILKQDASTIVLIKDIREFMDPVRRILDEKIYWFVAKNLPEFFDSVFHSLQEQGNRVGSLTWLPNDYPEMKVLEFLREEVPTAILATHYGSAQVLGTLREKGFLPDVKIGWLHTDYFEGYFPRISKRIDRTFLAHPELEKRWLSAGVSSELIETTGMPVNVAVGNALNRKACLAKIGFDPDTKTITIASGKEGAGDFAGVVLSLVGATKEPLQIIAVCGRNERQRRTLEDIRGRIPEWMRLEILGFIPQTDLVAFIRASDLFITKAGGLSPAEAFTLGKPTILLNVIGGHERENAKLFSKLGMAEFNLEVKNVGAQAMAILNDPKKQAAMLSAQQEFRANMDIGKIARFALDPDIKPRRVRPGYGIEKSICASEAKSALAQLEDVSPADMEVLLSYSSSMVNERIVRENPFGHIAIRVDETVYSPNHIALPDNRLHLLQHLNLEQYLFGVEPPSDSQVHTSTYGMSYGRETLGFRIKGLTPESLKSMHAEAAKIEKEFQLGKCRWDRNKSNCADFVMRILCAGGYDILGPVGVVTMPLDVFDRVRATFEDDSNTRKELVAYRRLPGSQASYRFSRFPLSLGQPIRSLVQILKCDTPKRIESSVSKQLTGYMGDERVFYENLSARLSTSTLDDLNRSRHRAKNLERILFEDIQTLITQQANLQVDTFRKRYAELLGNELRYWIDQSYEVSRIVTEHAEGILSSSGVNKLRKSFMSLMVEYAILNFKESRVGHLATFLEKMTEFHHTVFLEFSNAGHLQHELVVEVAEIFQKIKKRFRSYLKIATNPLQAFDTQKTTLENPHPRSPRPEQIQDHRNG